MAQQVAAAGCLNKTEAIMPVVPKPGSALQ